ncbi:MULTISPECIES: DUF4810 domain-containing protein [Amphritea]|uniref:DUF4810 domain-containing protein n=2 Tax=Amphritea TaxID=515417 RepID=A0A1H9E6M9_9GAMM|nr:DUF4810 domain-containing protein [Amphritea atlantica]SEQ21285.1 hypothetical protein SAMN03080615_00719 [Amphritea atlantica]
MKIFALLFVSITVLLGGCATQDNSLYYWGSYEAMIYEMYVEPGNAPAALQITKLEEDIQKSDALGKKVPPGLYAHLGMMYAAEGKAGLAQQALLKEKAIYPEATALVDTLLKNQKQGVNQ